MTLEGGKSVSHSLLFGNGSGCCMFLISYISDFIITVLHLNVGNE